MCSPDLGMARTWQIVLCSDYRESRLQEDIHYGVRLITAEECTEVAH